MDNNYATLLLKLCRTILIEDLERFYKSRRAHGDCTIKVHGENGTGFEKNFKF